MKIKRIIDISKELHLDTVTWPGDGMLQLTRVLSIADGKLCNLTTISMSLHTGTHVDAPLHFIEGGANIASLDLSIFIGLAKVFEVNVTECIKMEDIQHLPINKDDIVLFKTSNSLLPSDKFYEDYVYVDSSAAEFLLEKGVKTVGVDYLSIDGYKGGLLGKFPAHMAFLSNNIGIIEGLQLEGVKEGEYFLSCVPLKVRNGDGSPVRAVLMELE